jgi:hypothetical protein
MERPLQYPGSLDAAGPDDAGEVLARVAARLILSHQREDGGVATRGLARQLGAAAQACNVQAPVLLHAVISRLPPPAACRLINALPAGLTLRAPWTHKSRVFRALDALAPLRWSRYRLGRSRYAWVRQRAADRLGLEAFTVVERATEAAIARFAEVVNLHCFAHCFARDAGFRDRAVRLVRAAAAPELGNPSGAGQRLNMVALSDLGAWHASAQAQATQADHQLGAELVMLAIPATVFDAVTTQIRALMEADRADLQEDRAPTALAMEPDGVRVPTAGADQGVGSKPTRSIL